MSATLDLAKQFISQASITPDDAGCQTILSDYLKDLDFKVEIMQFEEVTNLWLRRG